MKRVEFSSDVAFLQQNSWVALNTISYEPGKKEQKNLTLVGCAFIFVTNGVQAERHFCNFIVGQCKAFFPLAARWSIQW